MKCPHCGYEADPDEEECPLCGTPLDGADEASERGSAGDGPGAARERAGTAEESGPGAAGDSPDGLTPWEAGGGVGALVDSWWESLSEPRRFFSRIDWQGGWASPLLYYLLFSVLGAAFNTVWSVVLGSALASMVGAEGMEAMAAGGSPLLQFFLSPFSALFSLAAGSAAAHVGVRLLASRPRSLGATARSFSYAVGPQVLLAVPFLGSVLGGLWTLVLGVLGLREAHRVSTLRAVGILVVGFFVLFVGLMLAGGLGVVLGLDQFLPLPAAAVA